MYSKVSPFSKHVRRFLFRANHASGLKGRCETKQFFNNRCVYVLKEEIDRQMDSKDSKKPEWLIDDYPPLSEETSKEAVRSQTIKYPKVVRKMDDPPIVNQMYGNLSFMFFDDPKILSTGKKVYGFCKVRGVWPTETSATEDSKRIIQEVDSRFQIRIAPVGAWVPLTNENAFCKDLLDVGSNDDMNQLRSEAIKQKEGEQRRIMRELKEREDDVQTDDIYDDKTTLTYYSMKRVTEMRLTEACEINRKKLAKIEHNQVKVRFELKRLEQENPQYKEEWVECYNQEREKSGIFAYVPGADEFDEYDKISIEELGKLMEDSTIKVKEYEEAESKNEWRR